MNVNAKIEVKVGERPQEGSLFQWDGEKWVAVTKQECFSSLMRKDAELKAKIESLECEISVLRAHVNTLAKAIGGNKE